MELRKVIDPASEAFSHAGNDSMVAGAYLWAALQSHRVLGDFTSQNWREYVSITGTINYHLLSFTMPLSTHQLM